MKRIKKDMADVCEEAHEFTQIQCEKKNIQFEEKIGEYTAKAQAIFDLKYDELVTKYKI